MKFCSDSNSYRRVRGQISQTAGRKVGRANVTKDREEFMRRVRWFSSNYAPAFGRLVTPLVQGIRVRGPFVPHFTADSTDLVLIDGQGFGHTPESTASVSTQVTKRYAEVDAILLVDNAMQSMLGGSVFHPTVCSRKRLSA